MIKKILALIWHWRLFSLSILSLVAGLILWFLKYHSQADFVLGFFSIIELIPIVINIYKDIRDSNYGINILGATAILTAVLLHQYWAAIVVIIILTGEKSLNDYANHRATRELNNLLGNSPKKAHLLRNKKIISVKIDVLKIKDRFIIKPGEPVPVDSVVIEGSSSFDESILTGENSSISKDIGEKLFSGSINLGGLIIAEASATAENSQYQQIIRLKKSAIASKSPFTRLANRYSIFFTILAYLIAGGIWYITGQPIRFLEVIIVATPSPLLLAVPVVLVSGISLAFRNGIVIKSGSALEHLAEAQTIALDKTGTLTIGQLVVDKIVAIDDSTNSGDLLLYAYSLEQFSDHIIANSIIKIAKERNLRALKVKKFQEILGKGLVADFRGQKIVLGNISLIEDQKIPIPKNLNVNKLQETAIFVAINNKLMGYITLRDRLRDESKDTISRLKKLGLKNILMLTGDNKGIAQSMASKLGISKVISRALPSDKYRAIEKLKKRPSIFVGDGVSDAPILNIADVGIALGAKGYVTTSESADILIMKDDLSKVVSAYKISKHTFRIAKQSILIGIGLSFILMLIFGLANIQPVYGAIVQGIIDIIIIFNALRADHLKKLQN
jgi:heavy metal translocating P-type ATPase